MSLVRLSTDDPSEIGLRDSSTVMTWAAVDDAIAHELGAFDSLGLGPEDRVGVFASNSAHVVLAQTGGLLAGVSIVPINFHLTKDELAFILVDAGVSVLIVGESTAEVGVAAAAEVGIDTVIGWASANVPGVLSWDDWLASATPRAIDPSARTRPPLIYTSGTSGKPKGIEAPPPMMPGSTIAETQAGLRRMPTGVSGRHLVVGPMYHTGPMAAVRTLGAGVAVVVMERFTPEGALAAIDEYSIGSVVMVPTHFSRLLALPQEVRDSYDVSSVKWLSHTGAQCPVAVKRAMIEWFGPVVSESYGASEVGTVCRITSEEWLEHPTSVGRVVDPPFSRAFAVGPDDEELPPGEEGRLFFEDSTGRGVIYLHDPQKTAEAHLRPGVFTLGEIGYVDADGYVYITDRSSDMIVSGGVNIYPAEAEIVLQQHPGVADVAIIGIPDDDMGESVLALVAAVDRTNPPSAEELIQFSQAQLARYKTPRRVVFVESLERTPMGKLNKRALREPYWRKPDQPLD